MTITQSLPIHHKLYASGPHPKEPPLVLVHGAGGDLMQWPTGLRRLAGRVVYALDLPGHGKSGGEALAEVGAYAQALREWAEGLALPPFVLVGHSMGGAIALEFSLRCGDRLAGLVLISTGARLRVAPQILTGIKADHKGTVDLLISWMYGASADPNLLRLGTRRLGMVRPEVLLADFAACNAFDRRADVARITTPTAVICGDADVMTPLKSSQYLHEQIAGSQLVVIPGAGHMAVLEQPAKVAHAIDAFVEGLS